MGELERAAPARLLKQADGPSRGLVAQEALDVARYITDMTAQLEAMAIAARLDLLAYFLGMARAESEIFVRTNAVAEVRARSRGRGRRPYRAMPEFVIASREQLVRLSSRSAQPFVGARAQRDAVAGKFDASGEFEFHQRNAHRARRGLGRPGQIVERDRRGAEQGDDALARRLGVVAGADMPLRRRRRIRRQPAFAASIPDRRRTALLAPERLAGLAARLAMAARSLGRTGSSAVSTSSAPVQIVAPCFRRSLVPSARGSSGEPGHGEDLAVLLEREARGDERARAPRRLDDHSAQARGRRRCDCGAGSRVRAAPTRSAFRTRPRPASTMRSISGTASPG